VLEVREAKPTFGINRRRTAARGRWVDGAAANWEPDLGCPGLNASQAETSATGRPASSRLLFVFRGLVGSLAVS
jgi:hypothetical protein